MPTLDLYHGGELPVRSPMPMSPRANRTLDFGAGFYATTSREQAFRWVGIRLRQNAYRQGCVSHYVCDFSTMAETLDVLAFNGAGEDWFDFVMANRHDRSFIHCHDVVFGPVANDNVYETLTLFEDGIIGKSEAIAKLKTYKLVNQLLFHTEASLRFLTFVDFEEWRS